MYYCPFKLIECNLTMSNFLHTCLTFQAVFPSLLNILNVSSFFLEVIWEFRVPSNCVCWTLFLHHAFQYLFEMDESLTLSIMGKFKRSVKMRGWQIKPTLDINEMVKLVWKTKRLKLNVTLSVNQTLMWKFCARGPNKQERGQMLLCSPLPVFPLSTDWAGRLLLSSEISFLI